MKIFTLCLALGISFGAVSQTVSYDDVAVIVNDNSQTSIDIGNYFQSARNIPNQNIIHINGSTSEEIDTTEFASIRVQIENYLVTTGLEDSINYLVTTKGVPLKVTGNCFDTIGGGIYCASFDSELALILGQYASSIGQNGSVVNPIFNSTQHFSRETSDVYLVTRLTGYKKQDVYDLIDRSGFETEVNQVSAQFTLDINGAVGGDSAYFHDQHITPTNDYLVANSWNSQVDAAFGPLLNQINSLGYVYFGYAANTNVLLNYSWVEGSFAAMETTGTASTFDANQNTSGELLLGDVLAEGCTGGHGYVNSNFFSLLFRSDILMDRYLNVTEDYNFAESFYMAEQRFSWQAVVVGDPKASVWIDNSAGIDDPEVIELRLHPNPTSGIVHLESNESISSITIHGVNGGLVRTMDNINDNQVDIDLSEYNNGVYFVHVLSDGRMKVERIVVSK